MLQAEPAVRCHGLVKIYWTQTGEVHALKGVDADFHRGRVTAVVGPSGSGKSSLLRILAGMDRPSAGSVEIEGRNLAEMSASDARRLRRRSIGYVFQRPSDNLVPYLTAWEHMKAAARLRGERGTGDGLVLLEALGLEDRLDHRPHQLSGGEQQRLAFAQTVLGDPALVVADEPTAELDSASANALTDKVRELARRGVGFVLSTHDPRVVAAADRTLHLRHGTLESETGELGSFAVIDRTGRVQLPQEALKLFPSRRARIDVDGMGVRITPP